MNEIGFQETTLDQYHYCNLIKHTCSTIMHYIGNSIYVRQRESGQQDLLGVID